MSSQIPAAWLVLLFVTLHVGCGRQAKTVTKAESDAMRFHECVTNGSLEDVRQALQNGADVNAPGHVGQTPLMAAIAAHDLGKMKLLIESGADPELTNDFNDTALRYAVNADFEEGVRMLLDLGVDRGYSPKYPLKKVNYNLNLPKVPLPNELKGVMSDEEWKESTKQSRELMDEIGQNPTVEPMIADVQSVEVLKLFLAAGDDLNLAPNEVKRSYVGLGNDGEFQCSPKDYRKFRSPRFGKSNPESMDNPFWRDMVRLGGSAYSARDHFQDTDSWSSPVWCYDRFGSSLTPLNDGRFVQVAGEHEDFYDPDFYIYNDVVIHDGKGGIKILGYPRDVFPPTDFHSATLVGDSIYLIGCLGYMDQREIGRTPVFRLEVDTWKINPVATSGEMPSWLHDHRAVFDEQRNVIRVEGGSVLTPNKEGEPEIVPNEERYELDLNSLIWRKPD